MKIKASLQISRNSQDVFHIRVKDEASRQLIVELEIQPADFARALTTLHQSDLSATVGNLSVVGKEKVAERRSVECPLKTYDRDTLEEWLATNAKEYGWTVDPYLGSQNSRSYDGTGKLTLHYSVFKYV